MPSTLAHKAILNALHFSGFQAASRYWLRGSGAILMLHRVCDAGPGFDPNAHLSVSPVFLDRLLGSLASRGVRFVAMDEIAKSLGNHQDRDRDFQVAITLDDGYRDNLENAVPVFRKHQAPYTIFVAPGLVDGRATLWWEDLAMAIASREHFVLRSPRGNISFDVSTRSRKADVFNQMLSMLTTNVSEQEQRRIVGDLCAQCSFDQEGHRAGAIMNWRELVALSKDPLCTLGAHTIHHYAVARLDEKLARDEMRESARVIEMETGLAPRHFAFPYGYPAAAGKREFRLARDAGFETAVTTRHGVLYPGHAGHLHALPRISLNGHFQAQRYVDTLLSGLPTRLQNRGRKLNVG
ncbi:MAG: polysaccharide deacetylase family protein [Nitratireductor sp.]